MDTLPTHRESSVLQVLRISLHVMFAFLLFLGCIMGLREGGHPVILLSASVLLGTVYLSGTVVENRYAHGYLGGEPGANLVVAKPTLARTWLAVITALWVFLFLQHLSFAWLMFPLVFLYLHLLPIPLALGAIALLTLFCIAVPVTRIEHTTSAGTFIGPVLGSLLAVVVSLAYRALYRDSLTHRHTAEKLQATQAELALHEHESGRAEERERLAREIHDTLAQGLSSIVLISRAAQRSLQQHDYKQATKQMTTVHRVAEANLAEARRFIRDLSSPSLASSLAPSLQRLCAETVEQEAAKGYTLDCSVRCNGQAETDLPKSLQQALLRIAQGALANVVAHARASRAVVTLGVWETEVTLDIFDNGRGFLPESLEEHTGFGFTSLRQRAEALGGSFSIDSVPKRGTVVSVSIPRRQRG